jgi:hypothetical protein
MNGSGILQTLPAWGVVALGALLVVQVVLDVYALVDLYRRPACELTIANKWIWVAIILVISTFGAIVYLIAGRKPVAAVEVASQRSASDRAANAADALYGAPKDADRR